MTKNRSVIELANQGPITTGDFSVIYGIDGNKKSSANVTFFPDG